MDMFHKPSVYGTCYLVHPPWRMNQQIFGKIFTLWSQGGYTDKRITQKTGITDENCQDKN